MPNSRRCIATSCARKDGSIGIIAVQVGGATIAIGIQQTTEIIAGVAVLIHPVVGGLGGRRIDGGIIVVAVATGEAVAVLIGVYRVFSDGAGGLAAAGSQDEGEREKGAEEGFGLHDELQGYAEVLCKARANE